MSSREELSQFGTLTPMLRQYQEIKRRYPGTLLFFRLGDFYEMFFDDALIGSRELEITLTARHKERGHPIPMCGVPHHAATGYIVKLVRKGYRVAICEQAEDPKSATKLVRREVVRVVTPGTAIESQLLESKENSYLAALAGAGDGLGLALIDLSTGAFLATQFSGDHATRQVREQLEIFEPPELVFPRSLEPLVRQLTAKAEALPETRADSDAEDSAPLQSFAQAVVPTALTPLDDWIFSFDRAEELLRSQLNVSSLDGFGLDGKRYAIAASGGALHYVGETQLATPTHFTGISYFEPSEYLVLDSTTVNNLDLVSSSEGNASQSLLAVVDQTKTGMGARLLRQWLLRPSINLGEIENRLDAVSELKEAPIRRDQLRRTLVSMADLERLAGRLSLSRANARDLISLRQSIELLPALRKALTPARSSLLGVLEEAIDELEDLRSLIADSIADEPPATLNEPGMIRAGYNRELDDLRDIAKHGKSFIAAIEARERTRTSISSLKVRFNNVFGYYIEVTNAHKARVPPDYERKQTLVNAERYTTPELKEYEAKVLGAEERILELESQLFDGIRRALTAEVRRIQGVAKALAMIDTLASLADVAARHGYVRPHLDEGDEIEIRNGRHPIIERLGNRFVPNDLLINNTTDRLLIVTGPNMGGKSVYLKQTALIVILAQMGSFVPAASARVPLVDRIFTRVGASDNLARGRSTFMVEMTETARILNTATPRSLILLDEVGRGTSTFDGLSLAWAIGEFIHDSSEHAAKTLFATHYHEMTELAKMRPGVRNYQVAVSEAAGEIVFLRRVVPGSASKSYGIEVARLAGLPMAVVERAREILSNLEQNELDLTGKPKFARHLKKPSVRFPQPSLLDDLEK